MRERLCDALMRPRAFGRSLPSGWGAKIQSLALDTCSMTHEERIAVDLIRQALAGTGQELLHCRGGRWQRRVGRFYLVDAQGRLAEHHIDLHELGRQLLGDRWRVPERR